MPAAPWRSVAAAAACVALLCVVTTFTSTRAVAAALSTSRTAAPLMRPHPVPLVRAAPAPAPTGISGPLPMRTNRPRPAVAAASASGPWVPAPLTGVFAAAAFVAGLLVGRPSPAVSMAAAIAAPDLKLYGSKGSRSPLVNWYLYEIDCEFQDIDAARVDRTAADYPHPFGQMPALRDGEVELFESGAILMYLADRYGGLDTPEQRAAAGKWVVWANATLDPICFVENASGGVVDTKLKGRPKALDKLDALLGTRLWLLGDEFSVADVAVGSYLLYVLLFFPNVSVAKWPNIAKYMEQCATRPAYGKAFGADVATTLAARCRK